tara:strand:+ start:527 stop:1087 length:561 start_codon:yes stop_codon:yes gene_type:complete
MKNRQIDRINNTNILNKYLNKIIPLLNKRLSEGYKLKKDGSLYGKDSTDIYAILNKNKPNNIRVWINSDKYRTDLHCDIHYNQSMEGEVADYLKSCFVTYIKQDLFLFGTNYTHNEFAPYNKVGGNVVYLPMEKEFKPIKTKFKIKTTKQIEKTLNKKSILESKIEKLTSELSNLKNDNNNFLKRA